ncbi:MAG: FHA domain-containing protein [Synergistaceae bacterium]|jgi:pSer/pThr/pTyr-binding forkhead associated (FHA) protein|nr:FHA domain-containing protein [Synergistaceae bacterium]
MEMIKLCPACNEENPVSEVICRVCMTNISSVSPTPKGGAAPPEELEFLPRESPREAGTSAETIFSPPEVLTFSRAADGRVISLLSGSTVGRSGDMNAFFDGCRTVSRRHALVRYQDGAWTIEDLGSTNGTWVNGTRIEPGRPCQLRKGDSVALSMACEMRIVQ